MNASITRLMTINWRRWLILRDWVVTFLRAEHGTWPSSGPSRTLLYLFYPDGSNLIHEYGNGDDDLVDRVEFRTIVTRSPPGLPPRVGVDVEIVPKPKKQKQSSSSAATAGGSGSGGSGSGGSGSGSGVDAKYPADWSCCHDPYLLCKGSDMARKCLSLDPENRPYHG